MSRAMKDSGIEWIGQIPKEWKLVPTKRLFSCKKQIAGENAVDYERLALTMQGVIKRDKEDNEGLQPEKFDGYQILKRNEIVFKLIDLANVKTSRVGLSPYLGIVSPAYIIIRNNSEDNRYFYYWFMFMYHHNIFNQMGDDGVRSSLNADDVLKIPIANISLSEQQKIANYLDKVCGEVDEMIALQEQMIEELKAYKQSVITEAVTRGLNPNVKFKDSGIDWIGKIPQGWELKKVKYVSTSINKGTGITKDEVFEDGDTPCVRYGEIYSKYNGSFVNCKSYTKKNILTAYRYFNTGDILFAGTGELVEEIGKSIVYLGEKPALAGGDIIILSHNQNPVYLNYALNSFYAQTQKSRGKAKLKVVHISSSEIGNIYLMLPPAAEQLQIADYLDNKCAEIDSLIAIKQQKIEELKDYKKSIIYEYVTGKKEI